MRDSYFITFLPTIHHNTIMKKDIHPPYRRVQVRCSCGNQFEVGSILEQESLELEICSQCHPFYTGKQKLVDTSGRVDRFRRRFGQTAAASKAAG